MRPYLGAYGLVAGLPPDAARATHELLAELPLAGLEVPLAAADAGEAWWDAHVDPAWDVVLTAIPTVMQRLATDPGTGWRRPTRTGDGPRSPTSRRPRTSPGTSPTAPGGPASARCRCTRRPALP